MSKGKRYNGEQKLNIKKVIAVIAVFIAIVLFVIGIKSFLKKDKTTINYFNEISYFSAYTNGKWGVINSKGENVISPDYGEMIIIPNKKKAVFVCMYEVNYADGSFKTKAVNSNNEQLFTAYNSVETLSNYDENNNIWYEENLLKVGKDGKYGLINLDGNEILRCEYDKIETMKGVKNSILIQKENLIGLVSSSGNIVIEPNYSEIQSITNEYNNGYIVKSAEGKYGIISSNKDKMLECNYSEIKHVSGNELFVVKEENKWKIVGKNGENPVEVSFEDIKSINGTNVIAKVSGKYGIYGTDNSEKVKPEYQDITYVFSDYYIVTRDNKNGIINSKGEVLVEPEYATLNFNKEADCIIGTKDEDQKLYLIDRNLQQKLTGTNLTVHNGYIRLKVDDNYKFYNLKLEEKSNRDVFPNNTLYVAKNNGKYGLVNKEGTLIVQYQYEDIKEQNEYGYVAVKLNGKWGVIDQYGNTVVAPKFDISDINDINVIGNWHQVENVNTVYYINE